MLPWFYSREAREAMFKLGIGPLYEDKPGDNKGGGGGGDDKKKKEADDDDDDDDKGGRGKGGFRKEARAMIARHANAEDAIVEMMRENRDKRQEVREARAKLPPEGAMILTGEEAAQITALGGPSKLKDALKERDELKTFKTTRELKDLHEEAAGTLSWDKDVLHDVAQARGLTVSVATEDVVIKGAAGEEDKKERRKVAKVKVGNGTPENMEDYFKRELKQYLPSLEAAKPGDKKEEGFTPFPAQESGEKGKGGDAIQREIDRQTAERAKVKNPLQAAAKTT